jgi:hypothetical protein
MATKEKTRPREIKRDSDRAGNLFLFSDLADGGKATRLDERDLGALRAVADWTRRFIIQPNKDLGRSGPICPFTPVALEHDALWLALEHTQGRSVPDMIDRVKGYNRRLLTNAPLAGEIAEYKAIIVVFADLAASQAKSFFEALLPPVALPFYEEDGLVIGPFYEGNDGVAIYNPQFRPFTSPVPSLLMRLAVASDWKFFLNNPEWFAVWARRHGEAGTRALAAELRRFPWNARGQ